MFRICVNWPFKGKPLSIDSTAGAFLWEGFNSTDHVGLTVQVHYALMQQSVLECHIKCFPLFSTVGTVMSVHTACLRLICMCTIQLYSLYDSWRFFV